MIFTDKPAARSWFKAHCGNPPPVEKARRDREIRRLIAELPEFAAAEWVSLYAADATEPDLLPLLAEYPAKRFLLPRYVAARREYEFAVVKDVSELLPGRYGLLEAAAGCAAAAPEAAAGRTLHLTPGVAFDAAGVRLGRGGGVYDRLLAGVSSPVCGVFYAVRRAESLPSEPHDRRLELAVTEEGILRFIN